MSTKLFDGSDESDNDLELTTNKDYAKSYNNFRKKELLKKFKDKGYDISESESSSDSGSSDDDEVVDSKFDEEFFKTLASLKSKDPAIYDKSTKFFDDDGDTKKSEEDGHDEETSNAKLKKTKQKPVTLKDYERQIILEKGGKFEEDTDDEEKRFEERPTSPTIVEEERRLKAEFRKVLNDEEDNNSDSGEEAFGGIFTKRQKTKEEQDQEDADFLKWLAGKKEEIKPEVKEKLEPLKKYWNSEKLPQNEKFLRDYILNKGYANAKSSEIPTYEEIVGDDAPLSEDEKELEKQAEFEEKFNFRFEDPDNEFIKRYPRTIENSLRQKDDKRKQKREETKLRKEKEKQQKLRELEMVKEMKRKEIEEKIKKLKLVTGNDELGFKDDELEEDFDPEAHDRRMQEIFNDEYYQIDQDEEKPECPSDIEELKYEDWDNYDPQHGDNDDYNDEEPHCEDDDFNMDCEYDPVAAKEKLQQELIENTKGKRKRRGKRNRFAEMLQQSKPVFNPEDEKSYADYIDEYYKIDCEDFIADLPCRFKYVETTPNDFGLTIEEILLAKNKELNQWASLKKAVQIRPEHIEKKEQRIYKMKAKNEDLKRKIFKSLYGEGSDDDGNNSEDEDENIKDVKKEIKENEIGDPNDQTNEDEEKQAIDEPAKTENIEKKSKKKRKRKAVNSNENNNTNESAEGTQTKRIKVDEGAANGTEPNNTNDNSTLEKKKNKKKKKPKPKQKQMQPNNPSCTPTNAVADSNNPFTKANTSVTKSTTLKSSNGFDKNKNKNNSNNNNKKTIGSKIHNTTPNGSANPFKKSQAATGETLPPTSKKSNHLSKNNKFKSKNINKKNFKQGKSKADGSKISDDRLKAYGINPRKFHKKDKYSNKQK